MLGLAAQHHIYKEFNLPERETMTSQWNIGGEKKRQAKPNSGRNLRDHITNSDHRTTKPKGKQEPKQRKNTGAQEGLPIQNHEHKQRQCQQKREHYPSERPQTEGRVLTS